LHFNKPLKSDDNNLISISELPDGRYNDDDSSLLAVDTLKVDGYSRVTFTKEVRRIFPIKPGDSIAFYQDSKTNEIIVRIQRDSKIVKTLRLISEIEYNTKEKNISSQQGLFSSTDKIKELAASQHYPEDPHKRYLPSIILIDDDLDILFTFQLSLSAEGFNVLTFSKPEDALKHLISYPAESRVVITDIRMPGMNGLELYQMLKSVHKDTKVLFLSALDTVYELPSIFPEIKEGDIIRKPVKNDEFVSKVKAAILTSV
jgi:CheY-like chemotaxis protein